MWASRLLLKSPGAALCRDYPHARLVTLSRPDALNTMTVAMLRDLYKLYVTEPHPDPDAVYVLRGDGDRAFCAGGDVLSLGDLERGGAYRAEFFAKEYEVDLLVATGRRTQVALWKGHILGSGVGISLHSKYRVACETARLAMPETQIGAQPDVGTAFRFSRLPVPSLGAYLCVTGESLRGADLLHVGLATHYAPSSSFAELQEGLLRVHRAAEVTPLLDAAMSQSAKSVPPFTLSNSLPIIEEAFAVTPETTVQGIMAKLQKDGSPFARSTLSTMERNSPTAMVTALENFKLQRALFGPKDIAKAMMTDLGIIDKAKFFMQDFTIGPTMLLKEKITVRPTWNPPTLDQVDPQAIRSELLRVIESCKNANADSMKGKGSKILA